MTPLDITPRFRRRDVRTDDAARQPAAPLPAHSTLVCPHQPALQECHDEVDMRKHSNSLWRSARSKVGGTPIVLTYAADSAACRGSRWFLHEVEEGTAG